MLMRLSAFAGIGIIALAAGALAHEIKHKAITIVHPWVMETEQPEAVLTNPALKYQTWGYQAA